METQVVLDSDLVTEGRYGEYSRMCYAEKNDQRNTYEKVLDEIDDTNIRQIIFTREEVRVSFISEQHMRDFTTSNPDYKPWRQTLFKISIQNVPYEISELDLENFFRESHNLTVLSQHRVKKTVKERSFETGTRLLKIEAHHEVAKNFMHMGDVFPIRIESPERQQEYLETKTKKIFEQEQENLFGDVSSDSEVEIENPATTNPPMNSSWSTPLRIKIPKIIPELDVQPMELVNRHKRTKSDGSDEPVTNNQKRFLPPNSPTYSPASHASPTYTPIE